MVTQSWWGRGSKLKMKNLCSILGMHMNNQIVEMFEDGHAYPVYI
jgi:hypothetical protein